MSAYNQINLEVFLLYLAVKPPVHSFARNGHMCQDFRSLLSVIKFDIYLFHKKSNFKILDKPWGPGNL